MNSIKLFSCFLLLIAATFTHKQAQASIFEASDTIKINTQWTTDTVQLTGDLLIAPGVTLTISPGILVESQGNFRIEIQGNLIAKGDDGDSIHFTINDPTDYADTSNTDGSWRGLLFTNTAAYDSSVLDRCIFEYAVNKVSEIPAEQGGAITLDRYSKIRISNSNFSNNIGHRAGAILCLEDIVPLIKNNSICNNKAFINSHVLEGAGAICCINSSPTITGNRIMYNSSNSTIFSEGGNPVIHGNNVSHNDSKGISIHETIWNVRISHNTIANNNGRGIDINNTDVTLINNLVCNNDGTGIRTNSSEAFLLNNTIANNNGVGLWIAFSSPVIINTIIDGNEGLPDFEVFIEGGTSPSFYNCLLANGRNEIRYEHLIVNFVNIVEESPEFMDPTLTVGLSSDGLEADWSLKDISWGLNSGNGSWVEQKNLATDVMGNKRVIHGGVDIGAIESHISSITAAPSISGTTRWIADTVYVVSDIWLQPEVTLRIAPGVVVMVTGYFKMEIGGFIDARGTPEEPIIFTSNDTIGIHDFKTFTGGWKGFRILYDTGFSFIDTNIFSYCIMEYIRSDQYGAIHSYLQKMIRFDHLTLRYNVVNDPDYKGGLSFYESEAEIDSCVFYGNSGIKNACIWAYDSKIRMNQNTFYNNNAEHSTLIKAYSSSSIEMNRQLIYNNSSDSSYLMDFESSQVSFTNSLFINNYSRKGGIYVASSPLLLQNSNIINNASFENPVLTIAGLTESPIVNSIITGNRVEQTDDFQISLTGENTKPVFSHCIVEGGLLGIRTVSGKPFTGTFDNCLDTIPMFTNPTKTAGPDNHASLSDWSVISLSPVINRGHPTTNNPGTHDIYGQPRINNSVIDIGAVEDQSARVIALSQPGSAYICEGDTIILETSASDTVTFQWKKDGTPIPGQTNSVLELRSVTIPDQGNYTCELTNSYGTTETNPAGIFINVGPKILMDQFNDRWTETGKEVQINLSTTGTSPMYYQWYKNGTQIVDAIYPQYVVDSAKETDEGSYYCTVSNTCGSISSPPQNLYLAPNLCMVTVSPTTGHNLVVWEKNSNAPIMSYKIYRESIAAGIYDHLASPSFDELSVFVDTFADPTVQAYLYKITAVDTSGFETDIDLCKPHKTIHLIVSTNPELNSTQLQWDRYYGFDYQTYTVYRSSTGLNFDPVHSLSASLNSWTDPAASSGDLFYRIAVEKPDPCVPEGSGKKAGTGPYQHALSNMDDNKLKAGQLPPDTIILTNNSIEEGNLIGAAIGKLVTNDGDSIDSHTYKFVPGSGDNDNLSFTLLGDLLLASESFDYDTRNEYKIRIRSTDEAGNYIEIPFIIQVTPSTGIHSYMSSPVRAYPNPFSHSTTITFPNPEGEQYKLILTDLSGKICRVDENITGSEYKLNKSFLGKGLYFLELEGPEVYRIKILIE